MILKDFLPNLALREFVQCYRIVHFKFEKTAQLPFKAYAPKPEECLHFILQDSMQVQLSNCKQKDFFPPIVLIGQQTSVHNRFPGRNFLNFQIVFQPTGIFRLTGIPAYELSNQFINAEYIFSKDIRYFLEELQNAKSYAEMLLIADNFVAKLICQTQKDEHLLDKAIKQIMLNNGNISLDWLARESCLCTKQFRRKFYERAGVNPKTYSRIIRFTKAFNTKNRHPSNDWFSTAIECGYFDYQHLAKDYKEFTGLVPNELHLLESKSPECVLGLMDDLYKSRI